MSGQVITIRGTHNDCWIVNRYISDAAQGSRLSCEEEWFDFLAAHWTVAYQEFLGSEVSLGPKVQFVLRRAPIVC